MQCPFLPDVDEADQEDQHEHQHLTQPEKGDVPDGTDIVHEGHEAGELLEVDRPRDHEHRLDVEDDEEGPARRNRGDRTPRPDDLLNYWRAVTIA